MNVNLTKSEILEAIESGEITETFAKVLFPNYFGNYSRRVLYEDGTKSIVKLGKPIIGVEWCPLFDGKSLWVNLHDIAIGKNWYCANEFIESLPPNLGNNWRFAKQGEFLHGFDDINLIESTLKDIDGADLIKNDNRSRIWGSEISDKYACMMYANIDSIGNDGKISYGSNRRTRAFLEY